MLDAGPDLPALRPSLLCLQEENVVSLGVVEHSPSGPLRIRAALDMQNSLVADFLDHGLDVLHFDEHDGLVVRRVGFHALSFEAKEGCSSLEPGMVAGLVL